MTSAIVRTNPTSGTATTSSVRDNFGSAADEINRLLRANTDKVVATGTNEISAQFGNVPTFSLVDGARVLIQIATTTTTDYQTLNVNGTGNVPIKKIDNTDLAIGDLIAGGYYEFVYHSGNDYWLVLNLPSPFSSKNKLFEAVLGGLYPVGGLLTTTNSANPGTAGYFFSGITFGTWEAYAQGRTIVGIASDATLSSGGITSDVATFVTDAAHDLLVGSQVEIVSVTGVVSPVGTHYVTAIPTSTSFSFALVGADETFTNFTAASLAKNIAFDTSQEVGGEPSVTLVTNNVPEHRHHILTLATDNSDLSGNESMAKTRDISGSRFSYAASGNGGEPDGSRTGKTILDSSSNDITQTAVNNLQPYITTYIWKRIP